jgi:hypothetical protein
MMNVINQIGLNMDKLIVQKVKSLEERVEELDSFSSSMNYKMNVVNEILCIMKEFQSGRSIYNRAVNRVELANLKYNVLERRKRTLEELKNENMPKAIKETFMMKQVHLIRSALKDINHRENFESKSAITVGAFLKNLEQKQLVMLKRLSKLNGG